MDSVRKSRKLDPSGGGSGIRSQHHLQDHHTWINNPPEHPKPPPPTYIDSGEIPDSWESIATDDSDTEVSQNQSPQRTVISLNPKIRSVYFSKVVPEDSHSDDETSDLSLPGTKGNPRKKSEDDLHHKPMPVVLVSLSDFLPDSGATEQSNSVRDDSDPENVTNTSVDALSKNAPEASGSGLPRSGADQSQSGSKVTPATVSSLPDTRQLNPFERAIVSVAEHSLVCHTPNISLDLNVSRSVRVTCAAQKDVSRGSGALTTRSSRHTYRSPRVFSQYRHSYSARPRNNQKSARTPRHIAPIEVSVSVKDIESYQEPPDSEECVQVEESTEERQEHCPIQKDDCMTGYAGVTAQSTHDVTSQSTHDVTSQSTHDVTLQSTHNVTAQSTHDVTAQSTHDVTSQSTHDVTLQSTHDVTAQSTHDVTAQSTHDVTLQSTHDVTLQSTHDVTAQSTHDVTAQSTHDVTTQSTHDVTAQSTNDVTAQSTHDVTAQSTHDVTMQSTHDVTAESTHDDLDDISCPVKLVEKCCDNDSEHTGDNGEVTTVTTDCVVDIGQSIVNITMYSDNIDQPINDIAGPREDADLTIQEPVEHIPGVKDEALECIDEIVEPDAAGKDCIEYPLQMTGQSLENIQESTSQWSDSVGDSPQCFNSPVEQVDSDVEFSKEFVCSSSTDTCKILTYPLEKSSELCEESAKAAVKHTGIISETETVQRPSVCMPDTKMPNDTSHTLEDKTKVPTVAVVTANHITETPAYNELTTTTQATVKGPIIKIEDEEFSCPLKITVDKLLNNQSKDSKDSSYVPSLCNDHVRVTQSTQLQCVQYPSVQNVQFNITESTDATAAQLSPNPGGNTDLDYISDDDNLTWEDPVIVSAWTVADGGGSNLSTSDSDADEFFSLDSDSDEDSGGSCSCVAVSTITGVAKATGHLTPGGSLTSHCPTVELCSDQCQDVTHVGTITSDEGLDNVNYHKPLGEVLEQKPGFVANLETADYTSPRATTSSGCSDLDISSNSIITISQNDMVSGSDAALCEITVQMDSLFMDVNTSKSESLLHCGNDNDHGIHSDVDQLQDKDVICDRVLMGDDEMKHGDVTPGDLDLCPDHLERPIINIVLDSFYHSNTKHGTDTKDADGLEQPVCSNHPPSVITEGNQSGVRSKCIKTPDSKDGVKSQCIMTPADKGGIQSQSSPAAGEVTIKDVNVSRSYMIHESTNESDNDDGVLQSSGVNENEGADGVTAKPTDSANRETHLTGTIPVDCVDKVVAFPVDVSNQTPTSQSAESCTMLSTEHVKSPPKDQTPKGQGEGHPTAASRPKLHTACTVLITDTDSNVTNTVDLDAVLEFGSVVEDASDVVSCAGLLETAVLQAVDYPGVEPSSPGNELSANQQMGDVLGACSSYCQSTSFAGSIQYTDGLVSYPAESIYSENIITSSEAYAVFTESTAAGVDSLSYGDSNMLASPSFTTTYDLGYSSDTEAGLQYINPAADTAEGISDSSLMIPPVGMQTCPHGYPTMGNTPVVVQASDVPLCSPPCTPDSSTILAGVYNTLAPLQCTLPPDCTIGGQSPRSPTDIAENTTGTMSTTEQTFTILGSMTTPSSPEQTDPGADYSTSSSPLECSGYSPDAAAIFRDSHIPMATIPNTTATIPAVITSTSEVDGRDTPASPTTSLQFRVQLKEFAFVGSCLKIAAKVSVTEEDADFWKHMHPGDVYFFSANSYVLCVQRSKQKKVATKAPGLNPNANVFHIKSPTTPPSESGSTSEWTTPEVDSMNNVLPSPTTEEFTLMNGDASKTPPGGIPTTFPPTPESPLSVGHADYTSMNGIIEGQSIYPTSSDPSQSNDDLPPLEGNMPDDQLRALLKTQLEYYFSRENLANDSYLVSQMDADQYVSIATIASFNQVKRLTHDVELVIEILRESVNVQVDEKGEKVRPLHKRCIVILREIPNVTPVEEVERLFKGQNCPPFISCEFAHNDNWYVTFDSEEDAQKAYRYLREEVGSFLGKPIMARIKAKPLLRSSFVPKNGFKQSYDPAVYSQQKFTQYPTVPSGVPFLPSQPVPNTAYPFFPPTVTPPTTTQPAASNMPHVWANSPPLSYFDPGTAFAANGYTPSAAIKLPTTTRPQSFNSMRHNRNQKPHRGGIAGSRDQGNHVVTDRSDRSNDHDRVEHRDSQRDRPIGTTRENLRERSDRDRTVHHDRHMSGPGRAFKSDSGSSSGAHHHNHHHHNSGPSVNSYRSGEPRSYHHHHHPGPIHQQQNHGPHPHNSHIAADRDHEREGGLTASSRHSSSSDVSNKDQYPQSQPPRRGGAYRGRRRPRGSEDNGANRSSSCPQTAKEKPPCDAPNFDLADTSFPPLPGSQNNTSSNEVFESESKLSDIVKGTAKPSIRDTARPASNSSSPPLVTVATTPAPPASQQALPTSQATPTSQAPPASQATPTVPASPTSQATSSQATPTSSAPKEVSKTVVTSQAAASSKSTSASTKSTEASVKSTTAPVKPTTSTNITTATTMTMAAAVANGTPAFPPTPPQSPQKLTKSTSTDMVVTAGSATGSTPDSGTTTTSTQTCSNKPGAPPPPITVTTSTSAIPAAQSSAQQDDTAPKKLSYAEMAQRGKPTPVKPMDKVKTDEPNSKEQSSNVSSSTTPNDAKDPVTVGSSATVSAAGATSSGTSRLPASREDTRDQRSFGPRRFNGGRWEDRRSGRDFDRENHGFDREHRGRDFDRENWNRDHDRENRSGFSRADRDKDRRGHRDLYDKTRGK